MTYIVRYRRVNQWLFRTIKGVKGDLFAEDLPHRPRIFILEDESKVEIPCVGTEFRFSKERFLVIKQNMEQQSGQHVVTKG